MLTTALLLLALQDAPAPVVGPPKPDAKKLDGIELIVNEEAVTVQDMLRELRRSNPTSSSPKEQEQQMAGVATRFVGRLLTIQAGKDMGFDDSLIDRLVKDDMQSTVDRFGSFVELGTVLDSIDMDPQMLREDKRSQVYQRLWEGAVDGRSAGPGGRPHVDRYVRPGRLLFEFRRSDPLKLAPAMITLQQLLIVANAVGGAEQALELANRTRDRLVAGEDFDSVAAELTDARQGKATPMEPEDLARVQAHSVMGPFAKDPVVGKVSEPIPLRPTGELAGYALLRIKALDVPDAPVFGSGDIQKKLRTATENRLQTYRRERELSYLLDAAYVWPPEVFGRAKAEPDAVDD